MPIPRNERAAHRARQERRQAWAARRELAGEIFVGLSLAVASLGLIALGTLLLSCAVDPVGTAHLVYGVAK